MSLQDEFSALGQNKINIRNAIQSKGVTLTSPNDMTTYAEAISGIVVGTRNIGEIIQSTIPLTDAGLHLLDGALISGSGSYSDFVDYIASIYDSSANYFCTETEWQQAITDYGVCGKFVYDSVNNTVRLPKYSNKIYTGGGTTLVKGNGKALGITNGTDDYGMILFHNNLGGGSQDYLCTSSDGLNSNVGTSVTANHPTPRNVTYGLSTNAENSGVIADLSNITTSLDGYYYIVVATSTKTDIQVDIDEIATDLNGKADVDLSNTNNQAKILMSGMGMPSNTYIDLTLGASGTTYTAPANGYFYLSKVGTAAGQFATFENSSDGASGESCAYTAFYSGYKCVLLRPVKKGTSIQLRYDVGGATQFFRFIYAVGSESEAQ